MGVQALKDDYKEMALLRQWEEKAQAAIHSQHSEHWRRSYNIINNCIYKTSSQSLPSFAYVTLHCMPGHRLTQSQYAHQKNVEHFRNLIVQLDEQALTHIPRVVWLVVISIGIGYPVHRYVSTGLLLIEEFSEDSLFPGEV